MRDHQSRPFAVSTAASATIAAMFAALIVLLALWLYESRITAERRVEERTIAATKIVATNARWINALAWQALKRIDETLGAKLDVAEDQKVVDINEAIDDLPGDVQAYVVEKSGRTVYSNDPNFKPINITDRDYFSKLAAGADQYVSSLLISRLSGKQIFVFSRRLERNGAFVGAAVVAFEVNLLVGIWESVDLGPNSTVSLIRNDGMLVARYPLAKGPLDMSDYVLFTKYLPNAPSGTYLATSPLDGAVRRVGYRKVEGTEFIAVGSADHAVAMRPFWRDVYIAGAILGLAAVGSLVAGGWIAQLLRRDTAKSVRLSAALDENRLLLREIHHRVKNNLQSVQAVIRMQQLPADMQKSLSDRIAAMVAVHEQIYSRDQFLQVSARDLIPAVVDMLMKAYGSSVAVSYDIDDIAVSSDNATPLALLVNEVVTNSLKYAFPDGRAGTIAIAFRMVSDRRARLVISDDGVGMNSESARSGMGTRLIRGVIMQFQGEFGHEVKNGTTFTAELDIIEHERRNEAA